MKKKIAFIGAGRMATAIVKGLIQKKVYSPNEIVCLCGNDNTGSTLAQASGITEADSLLPYVSEMDTLVLACKPQQLENIDASTLVNASHITLISILAGTPIARLSKCFPQVKNIIRSMPNTPGQIGCGSTAYASLNTLEAKELDSIETILGALGSVHPVNESQIDAVTALSGSGPAYVFEFISALVNAGINTGLEENLAKNLALETVLGSAQLLKESTYSADDLRDAVTSPGGTTEAALNRLSEGDFRALIQNAILKAKKRSEELAQS
ncbi:MAG: pyrroline-5-carboxylate reductase [Opitutae bacterium]|jgi:pyrroline-5-carboxylate reductase|nr:pyrroline-5-carboxylate reductase [Opitutae bacterium]